MCVGASLRLQGTYRDKNAVRVLGLAGLLCAHQVSQALDVVDAHHVDVVVEAERLDEGEVDLEGHVFDIIVVRSQNAKDHVVRISEGWKKQKC